MPLARDSNGRLGVRAQGSDGSSGIESIRVEIVNQGNNKSQVESVQPRFDGKSMVLGIILNDLRDNGQMTQAMARRFGG